jgi:glycosyltransferase involved in cell wall biosynthesis
MGAPQNRLYELALGMQTLGWSVEVITSMPNYPTGRIFDDYRGTFYRKENISGLTVHRYTLYPSKSSSALPRIISMLSFSFTSLFSIAKIGRGNVDYLMVESPPLPLAFTGWLLSKFSKSKLIMNVSDLWPLSAKELGAISDGKAYRLLTGLESFLYRKAAICTGQSQEIVDYISSRKKKNVWLLRNGVDTARFDVDVASTRTNKIVYAGLLGIAQGILSIVENIDFRALGLEFHIYGSGNEKEAIEKYLAGHPSRGVVYQGVLGRDKIPQTLASYDATLVALVKNIYGAVPSKIYEAMAASLPILFSGVGEGARIIQENDVGWQNDPGDWKSLIHNLTLLKQSTDEELLELKRRARSVAIAKFDRGIQIADFHQKLSKQTA